MVRKKLETLLNSVEKVLSIAEIRYEETKTAAEEMSKTSRTSWSAAGDRVYADGQKQVNEQNQAVLLKLKVELENAVTKPAPSQVETPCFIKFDISGNKTEAFFVKNIVNINNHRLLSENSPIGKELNGKKLGEKFIISGTKSARIMGVE